MAIRGAGDGCGAGDKWFAADDAQLGPGAGAIRLSVRGYPGSGGGAVFFPDHFWGAGGAVALQAAGDDIGLSADGAVVSIPQVPV